MDDDEVEIRSPSPSNGRITVTVAVSQPPQQKNNSLALATIPTPIPIQIQQAKSNGGGGGREDCWSEGATAVLIEAWGKRYVELSRGNLKQKHWKEVAEIVSSRENYRKPAKTEIQCKNRIDTVKKKYKVEKAKIANGGGASKWRFFEQLDHLIGPLPKNTNSIPVGIPVSGPASKSVYQKVQLKRGHGETESSEEVEEESLVDSDESLPPEKKRRVVAKNVKEKRGWGNSIRMLTQAMLKFGEAYEQAETAKIQQLMEMEKARMLFAKDLELQRMHFFMKTQMEISQLKPCNHPISGNNNNNTNNLIKNKSNKSDSDN